MDPAGRTFWLDGVAGRIGPPIEVVGIDRHAMHGSLREENRRIVFQAASGAAHGSVTMQLGATVVTINESKFPLTATALRHKKSAASSPCEAAAPQEKR
jgi:hypothetical protein